MSCIQQEEWNITISQKTTTIILKTVKFKSHSIDSDFKQRFQSNVQVGNISEGTSIPCEAK